jgi:hypothetical protein
LKKVDTTPAWSKAKHVDLDIHALVQSLDHPCDAVAITAAELLCAGVGGEEASHAVERFLQTGDRQAHIMIGAIAPEIWGERALNIILTRLEGELKGGCAYLFKSLRKLIKGEIADRTCKCLIKGITNFSPIIAAAAAETCALMDIPSRYADEIERALKYWKENEPPYTDERGFISTSPRAYLLHVLTKMRTLSIDDLLIYCSDIRGDIREAAIKALVDMAKTDKDELAGLLRRIMLGDVPIGVLKSLLDL